MNFAKHLIFAGLTYLVSASIAAPQTDVAVAAPLSISRTSAADSKWQTLITAAATNKDQKLYDEAEKLLKSALEEVKGEDENRYIVTLCKLVDLADVADWDDKNLSYCQQISAYYAKSKPKPTGMPFYNYKLGLAYYYNKNYKQAIALMRPSITEMESLFSQNNPYLADMYDRLSRALKKAGKDEESRLYEAKAETISSDFMKKLQDKIKRAWYPPKRKQSLKCMATFVIELDGKLANTTIKISSGDKEFDKLCLRAIDRTELPIVTWEFYSAPRAIASEFDFSYNVQEDTTITANPEEIPELREKFRTRLLVLENKSEKLTAQDMRIILALTSAYRNQNKTEQNEVMIDSLRKTPTYGEKECGQTVFIDALPSLDLARKGSFAEAEVILKSVTDRQAFSELPEVVGRALLKVYGDVLYKQNKIEEASAIYKKMKEFQNNLN